MKLNVYVPADTVKVCIKDTCIEAEGDNGKTIVNALCFVAFCVGIAELLKSIK